MALAPCAIQRATCQGKATVPSITGTPSLPARIPTNRSFAALRWSTPPVRRGDLTVDNYYSTEGWNTPESDAVNYNSGNVYEEDVYRGNSTSGPLLRKTTTTYSGTNGQSASCLSQLNS